MMAHSEAKPEEVGVGGNNLDRNPKLLAQLLLVAGSSHAFLPSQRELGSQLLEQVVRERAQKVVAISEVLVKGRASDPSAPSHHTGGQPAFATCQNQLPRSRQ